MKRRRSTQFSFVGALILFVTVSVVATVAILVHDLVEQKLDSAGLRVLVMFLVIVLLAGVCVGIDYWRRKKLVEAPTRKILEATDRIAAGDFTVRMDITHTLSRYDEYDSIMENLNRMTEELGKTALLHGDFVSNVSHEIKTPLAVIRSYVSALATEKDELKRSEFMRTITAATDKLTALVGNVLKLNKLENSVITPEYTRINLADMLAECVLGFEERIDEKGIEIECDFEDAEVYSAAEYLTLVWNNLISNAVKFTPDGGKITVKIRAAEGGAEVTVTDTGCGISSEVGARIFEKFYQADGSHAHEGNGLGLPLVKRVIDVLGGEIWVESKVGEGTAFTVRIRSIEEK